MTYREQVAKALNTPIVLVGDIHGDLEVLAAIAARVPEGATIVQVGDFGLWPVYRKRWTVKRPVYFIDGNHDHIPSLFPDASEPVEIWPNAIYVPRGVVLTVGEYRVLCCGGSKSLDRAWRSKDSESHGWFEAEQLTDAQTDRAIANAGAGVDLLVTHTPPDCIIRRNFSPNGLRSFGHDPDTWVDESSRNVERLWDAIGNPPLVCGHMHQAVSDGQCRILDINEVVPWAAALSALEGREKP